MSVPVQNLLVHVGVIELVGMSELALRRLSKLVALTFPTWSNRTARRRKMLRPRI